MKKLKIICTTVIAVAMIALFFATIYPFEMLKLYIEYAYYLQPESYTDLDKSIFLLSFYCLCAIIVFVALVFLLIVIWKADLKILTDSVLEKTKEKRKAAKQAKLQREIADKTAQLEELNNQPSGEENGE